MTAEKQAIVETVTNLIWAVDRRDFALAKDQFADLVTVDYISLFGGDVEQLSAQSLVDRWSRFLPNLQMTQHTLSNFRVDVSGNQAICTSYVQGFHYLPYTEGGSQWLVMGYYTHHLINLDGGWKITLMKLTTTYEEGNRNVLVAAGNFPTVRSFSFDSEGDQLAGQLLLPPTYQPGEKLPAVIVTGSWTTVKEQMPTTYARLMAQRGFAAFLFDFRGFGESDGAPRQYESATRKVADIRNAITFLASLPEVDANQLAGLAVCASAGYMAVAAATDTRLKAFAAVAPWLHNHDIAGAIYGGEPGMQGRIDQADQAQARWEATGESTLVPACSPTDDRAPMFGQWDYYLNPRRGAIPAWKNEFNVMSWKDWLTFDPIRSAPDIQCPVYLIHSHEAAIPQGVQQFYDTLTTTSRNLTWMSGQQFDFYDSEPTVLAASSRVADWLHVQLS
ncbi:alpha/beta fold hydrolase [Larkinella sp. VNQ87]|uniref:alpha/beta fold hydrolase n=1 Tax=Larkinella sp. VNQ87 TaxID=3400921 RepID=UPI003C098F89